MNKTASDSQSPAESARFAEKVAVVTGAGDRGIGGAIAEQLGREGARLSLLSRSQPKRLPKRLERMETDYHWTACDVTQQEEVDNAVAACVQAFGQIDVLVNNAGVELARSIDEFEPQDWAQLIDVNLHGAIRMIQAALPHFGEKGGVIVNVASALGLGGCSGFSIYSASKAGLIGLTQSLAWELAPRQIRVVTVAPGMVHTPMIHKHTEHLTPEVWQQIEAAHPLGMGMPQDVAEAVAFLASPAARWITGVTLPLGWATHYPLPVDHFMS